MSEERSHVATRWTFALRASPQGPIDDANGSWIAAVQIATR